MSGKKIIILSKDLSRQIKDAIYHSRKTLDQIKADTGISKSKLSRLQNGKAKYIDEAVVEKLSGYLGIKIYIPSNEEALVKRIVDLEKENRQLKELLLNYIDGKERDVL